MAGDVLLPVRHYWKKVNAKTPTNVSPQQAGSRAMG